METKNESGERITPKLPMLNPRLRLLNPAIQLALHLRAAPKTPPKYRWPYYSIFSGADAGAKVASKGAKRLLPFAIFIPLPSFYIVGIQLRGNRSLCFPPPLFQITQELISLHWFILHEVIPLSNILR